MSVDHQDVFFGEVSIHIFCPFLRWIICFLVVEFDKFFLDFGGGDNGGGYNSQKCGKDGMTITFIFSSYHF